MVTMEIEQNYRKITLEFESLEKASEMADKILPYAKAKTDIRIACGTEGEEHGI